MEGRVPHVATHRRKSPQRTLSGDTVRTAATLALAGAATATGLGGTAHAAPTPTPAQIGAKADRLYREAEVATEKYDGAKEAADHAGRRLSRLQDEAARRTERLNAAREALGVVAAAQYRDGGLDPSVQLALSSDPNSYLEKAEFTERAGALQASAVNRVREHLREIERLRGAARVEVATLNSRKTALAHHKKTINDKLGEARHVLSRLSAEERARISQDGPHTSGTGARIPSGATSPDSGPVASATSAEQALPATSAKTANFRAAAAIAYAFRKLGSPYVWGATGPHAFDCSGLVQAAYRSAGVSLPRTTYAQIGTGRRVSRSQLAPGDLVFFYSGVSHVGIYVGNGQMIHAPNPSAPVRMAPIDQMPFAGATRVV